MKSGKTLQELAAELERIETVKKDYVVTASALKPCVINDSVCLTIQKEMQQNVTQPMGITEWGHVQLGNKLGVPKTYYDRMLDNAQPLLIQNLDHWLNRSDKSYFVRTLDNNVRAVCSDRYKPTDNYGLAKNIFPILAEKQLKVESCEVTDRNFYLKCLFPRMEKEFEKGDVVQGGFVIRNSEVGCGVTEVTPLIYRLACKNGLIVSSKIEDLILRKKHLGGKLNIGEYLSADTLNLMDHVVMEQMKDLVTKLSDQNWFNAYVEKLKALKDRKFESGDLTINIPKVVEVTSKELNLSKNDNDNILRHLIEGGDLSQWGLVNALTRHSQDIESYEKATELERAGGRLAEYSQRQWEKLLVAA